MLPNEDVGHIPEGGMLSVVILILVRVLTHDVEAVQVVVNFKTCRNLPALGPEPRTLSCLIQDILILVIKFKGPDCRNSASSVTVQASTERKKTKNSA